MQCTLELNVYFKQTEIGKVFAFQTIYLS